jgi:hypothetical protein
MTEIEALYRRRRHLLEQIGKASDEINRIDERLAYLISPTFEVDRPMMKSEYYTILKKRAESLSLK